MKKLISILALMILSGNLFAYDKDVRAEIDIDRRSLLYNSQEAFEKSREYIRKDSTYYIGWMLQGAFLFNRANDEKGFLQAIAPLQKAFDLIERDYDAELRTRTNDYLEYWKVNYVQSDYANIANWLSGAYQNIERAQNAYEVLKSFNEHDLQFEYTMESWNTLAWLYHRNRMYTSEKFPFLKNSVEENDSIAYACLDSAVAKTQRDIIMCNGIWDASTLNARYYFTYHYKVILFTYDFKLDSADYYYDILLESGYYSSNNYANYMYMKGEFGIAEQFYLEAEQRDNSTEKHTREYYYMRGLLEINRATPGRADTLLGAVINRDGQTPGYGWHKIAHARAYTYSGLTAKAQRNLNEAAGFEELHIGTTWGEEQYNLSVAMLNYLNAMHFESEYYFENNEWYFWLNPYNWYKSIEFKMRVHHFRLILVSLVAANPEREEVIYPLLSSENLLSWDESWQMLDGFSNEYFIGIYEKMLENDPRPGIKNYIRFVLAKLYIADGDDAKATEYLNEIYSEIAIERMDFDNLLYARTCEALSQVTSGDESQQWLLEAYNTFPQMIPYSDSKLNFQVMIDGEVYRPGVRDQLFKLAVWTLVAVVVLLALYIAARRYMRFRHSPKWIYAGAAGAGVLLIVFILWSIYGAEKLSTREQIIASFADCNIGFTEEKAAAPMAQIQFVQNDSMGTDILYTVIDGDGRLVNEGSLTVNPDLPNTTGILLAYRMFNINTPYTSEEVEPVDVNEETPAADSLENLSEGK